MYRNDSMNDDTEFMKMGSIHQTRTNTTVKKADNLFGEWG